MSPFLIARIILFAASLILGAWGSGNAYQLANLPEGVCASPGETMLATGPLAGAGLSAILGCLTFLERFFPSGAREVSQALRALVEWQRDPTDKVKQRAFIIETGEVIVEIVRAKSPQIAEKLAALLQEIYAEFLKPEPEVVNGLTIEVTKAVSAKGGKR